MNPVELSLFVSRMEAVCEEMGTVLRRTAFSPNIKDRLDFSCAVFDARGELCAQAAHIPVHLGSMAFAMAGIVSRFDWQPGQVLILNDPFLGGTHLPDVTLIAPVFSSGRLAGFTVNRAHHANIGSDSPGSMPVSTTLEEEGVLIPPSLLCDDAGLSDAVLPLLNRLSALDDDGQLTGDLAAQLSSVRLGCRRLLELIDSLGSQQFEEALTELNRYAEVLSRQALSRIPAGEYGFTDMMDDDGSGTRDIRICVTLKVRSEPGNTRSPLVTADFSGTAPQVKGNINCPLSVAAAAVYYVFRCLMPDHAPACAGLFRPVRLQAEPGTVINASPPAAVTAGNVETSSRLVDVIMGALAKALPAEIPAASQGTMNNIAMGRMDCTGQLEQGKQSWDYYETLAGGHGGSPNTPGGSAMHSHMTNTLNTPVESLELHYPLEIECYSLRDNSGGTGRHTGGNGLVREYRFLDDASLSLLTERRRYGPWGLGGGGAGTPGRNLLNGEELAAKCSRQVKAGDVLRIETPGGGGWGTGPVLKRN